MFEETRRKRTIEGRDAKEENERSRLLASRKRRPLRGNKKWKKIGEARRRQCDSTIFSPPSRLDGIGERAGPRVPVRFCVDAIRSYVRRFGISILIRRIEERDGNSRFACVVRACNRCRLRSNDLVAARVGIPDPNVRRYKSEKDGICTPKAAHRQRETDEKRGLKGAYVRSEYKRETWKFRGVRRTT